MLTRILTLFIATFFLSTLAQAQVPLQERPDWKKFFSKYEAQGTIFVLDERSAVPAYFVFDSARATKRFSPASTFKIPHTLFALDAGLIRDEFQVFAWDGVKRSFEGHNPRNGN